MQQIRNHREYVKFLEDYMFISEANRPITGSSYKLPFLADSIKDYRDKRMAIGSRLKFMAILFNIILTSMVMGVAIIWGCNEVLRFEIAYSLRNISIVAFVFLIGKTRVGLFREIHP